MSYLGPADVVRAAPVAAALTQTIPTHQTLSIDGTDMYQYIRDYKQSELLEQDVCVFMFIPNSR